jgi:hypothetical protein
MPHFTGTELDYECRDEETAYRRHSDGPLSIGLRANEPRLQKVRSDLTSDESGFRAFSVLSRLALAPLLLVAHVTMKTSFEAAAVG